MSKNNIWKKIKNLFFEEYNNQEKTTETHDKILKKEYTQAYLNNIVETQKERIINAKNITEQDKERLIEELNKVLNTYVEKQKIKTR